MAGKDEIFPLRITVSNDDRVNLRVDERDFCFLYGKARDEAFNIQNSIYRVKPLPSTPKKRHSSHRILFTVCREDEKGRDYIVMKGLDKSSWTNYTTNARVYALQLQNNNTIDIRREDCMDIFNTEFVDHDIANHQGITVNYIHKQREARIYLGQFGLHKQAVGILRTGLVLKANKLARDLVFGSLELNNELKLLLNCP